QIAVIGFDDEAETVVPLTHPRAAEKRTIAAQMRGLVVGDHEARLVPPLVAARELLRGVKTKKLVLVIGIGNPPALGVVDAAKHLHDDGAVVSTVLLRGEGRDLFGQISEAGDGRLYVVEDVGALPRIAMKELAAIAK